MELSPTSISSDSSSVGYERLKDEPAEWYARFAEFACELGYDFSVRRSYRLYNADCTRKNIEPTIDYYTWLAKASEFQWATRAVEWREDQTSTRRLKWAKRAEDVADSDWTTGGQLRALALQFLEAFSVYKTVGKTPSGETIVQITTTPVQVAQMAKISSELQRLAVGEPTEITRSEVVQPRLYLPIIGDPNAKS